MTTTKTSQKPQFLILLSYTIVWLFSLISFWCCSDDSNAAGYAIVFFYGLFPITTFATSAVIGAKGLYGNWKWITPVKLGIMYMLADYCTFRLANSIAFEKLNSPE